MTGRPQRIRGLTYGRSTAPHLAVGVGGEHVADVVQQAGDDVLLVAPVAVSAGRRLQRMLVQRRDCW